SICCLRDARKNTPTSSRLSRASNTVASAGVSLPGCPGRSQDTLRFPFSWTTCTAALTDVTSQRNKPLFTESSMGCTSSIVRVSTQNPGSQAAIISWTDSWSSCCSGNTKVWSSCDPSIRKYIETSGSILAYKRQVI